MVELPNLPGIPKPVGPYSQVAIAPAGKRTAYIAGQVAADLDGNLLHAGDFRAQCRAALANVGAALAALGASFEDVVYIRGYLTRAEDFPAYREERERFFAEVCPKGAPPTTTAVIAALYHPDCLYEVDAVAVID